MTNDILLNEMASLSQRMNKMESSLREFEKQRHQPLADRVAVLEYKQSIDKETLEIMAFPIGELIKNFREMAEGYSNLDMSVRAEDKWLQEQIDGLKKDMDALSLTLKELDKSINRICEVE